MPSAGTFQIPPELPFYILPCVVLTSSDTTTQSELTTLTRVQPASAQNFSACCQDLALASQLYMPSRSQVQKQLMLMSRLEATESLRDSTRSERCRLAHMWGHLLLHLPLPCTHAPCVVPQALTYCWKLCAHVRGPVDLHQHV